MNLLLRPRIWSSFRASPRLTPCSVLFKYASDPRPCGCPVASPSSRSRYTNSWNMRASQHNFCSLSLIWSSDIFFPCQPPPSFYNLISRKSIIIVRAERGIVLYYLGHLKLTLALQSWIGQRSLYVGVTQVFDVKLKYHKREEITKMCFCSNTKKERLLRWISYWYF